MSTVKTHAFTRLEVGKPLLGCIALASALAAVPALAWERTLPAATWFDADFDETGNAYIGLQPVDGESWVVHRLDSQGQDSWSVTLDQGSGIGPHGGLTLCGADLCVNPATQLSRLDASSGEQLWVKQIEGNAAALAPADDGVLAYSHFNSGLGENIEHARYDADGNLQSATQASNALFLSVNDSGVIAYRDGDNELHLLGPDESSRPLTSALETPAVWSSPQWRRAVLDASEKLTYLSPNDDFSEASLVRVDASTVAWTSVLFDVPASERLEATQLIAGTEGKTFGVVAFAPVSDEDLLPANRAEIFAVDNDGNVLWRNGFIASDLGESALAHRNGKLLLATPIQDDRLLMLRGFDAVDGRLLGLRLISCNNAPCERVVADVDGELRAMVATGDTDGAAVKIFGDVDVFDQPGLLLNQTALNGQWYAPYTDGQGVSLRFFPDSSTLFLAWFTYGLDGGDDAEQLRWYTLQSTIELGAREAIMPILQRTNGRFQEPGSEQAIVGEARLRFTSCREGTLEYRFDEGQNAAATGSIALFRLLPLSEDCIEATGDDAIAEATPDPVISGHWYDPANAGQGLELLRMTPTTPDSNAILFGTWFTYDPEAPTNEPRDQHWFTLQVEERDDDGVVHAAIVQTLGGRFDSESTDDHQPIGSVELIPQDSCDRLDLRYTFDDADSAGAFRGLTGDIQLHRIGECDSP